MIEHLVLIQWKADASPEAITQAMDGLRALRDQVPGILGLTCGENFNPRAQGYTHALVIRFEDKAALDAYNPHPAHQKVVQEMMKPIVAEVLVLDFEI